MSLYFGDTSDILRRLGSVEINFYQVDWYEVSKEGDVAFRVSFLTTHSHEDRQLSINGGSEVDMRDAKLVRLDRIDASKYMNLFLWIELFSSVVLVLRYAEGLEKYNELSNVIARIPLSERLKIAKSI